MLKEIGFDAISLEWIEEDKPAKTVDAARECGLIVQSLHAPF